MELYFLGDVLELLNENVLFTHCYLRTHHLEQQLEKKVIFPICLLNCHVHLSRCSYVPL